MTREEFARCIAEEPAVAMTLRRALTGGVERRSSFGTPTELAMIALMFPVASFVITHIGLPWLYEAGRYAELWRQKFHRWIDGEYDRHNLDPDEAEAAGEALRRELQATTDTDARAAWERLAKLMPEAKDD